MQYRCDYGAYNDISCNWDGGDCCAESCRDGDFTCGSQGYQCYNPLYTLGGVTHPLYKCKYSAKVGDGRCEPSEHQALGSYSTLCTHCTHSVLQPPAKLTLKKLREKTKLGNHFKTLENIWELQKKNLKKGWEFMLECGN